VAVSQRHPGAVIVIWRGLAATDAAEIATRVRRWLSADWEPEAAIEALPDAAVLIERGGGRLLRGSSFYEDFIKTVLTINANWSATCRMAAALVREPGGGSFPGPLALVDYGEERLRERAKLGFRARTVVAATRQMLDDGAITAGGNGAPDRLAHDYLIARRTAACCCMISAGSRSIPPCSLICARNMAATRPSSSPAGRNGGPTLHSVTEWSGFARSWRKRHYRRQNKTSGGSWSGWMPSWASAAMIHVRI